MRVKCPQCGQVVTAPDDAKDAQGRCPHCDATFGLAAAERVGLSAGDRLGDFRIDGLIGRGGMATVYRATQLSLDRPVAIKVLAPRLARRKQFVERFQREAQVLARLSHPNIVRILSVGTHWGLYYLVMEYVDGESLRARVDREGRLGLQQAARLIDQVAAGLAYAHEQGVLHRDIKPANILLMADATPRIVDFGIARIVGRDSALAKRLTMASTQMGSAHYMAPEQMKDAAAVDHRADIYALGVLLYETLTGELPIGQFRPASRLAPGVPTSMDRVIRTALAASPDARFSSLEPFRAALQRAALVAAPTRIREPRPQARHAPRKMAPPAPILVGSAALLVALILVVWFVAGRGKAPSPDRHAVRRAPTATPAVTFQPTEAEKCEKAAGSLFSLASKRAALGEWRMAKSYLDRLDKECAHTKFYAANRAAIARLRKQIDARLRPKTPATKAPVEPTPAPKPGSIEELAKAAGLEKGLAAAFYGGTMHERFVAARHVAGLDFNWGLGAPVPDLPADHFSAHFIGWLCVREPGDYTFQFLRDDGARLYIDGHLLVNEWGMARLGEPHVMRLEPGWHRIWVAFLERTGAAAFCLSWGRGGEMAKVPTNLLYCKRELLERVRRHPEQDPCRGLRPTDFPDIPGRAAAARPVRPGHAPAASAGKLYASAAKRLAPLWVKRQCAEALTTAQALAGEQPLAASDAARWIVEDARALADLWKAVEAGAAKLRLGENTRVGGMAGEFEKLEDGTISVRQGAVGFAKKLTGLRNEELVELARKARALGTGSDHLALALLWLHADKPDLVKAGAELAVAEKADINTSRHRALLDAVLPKPKPKPTTPAKREEPDKPRRERQEPLVVHIKLRLDGVSDLVITPAGLHWEHQQWSRPGTTLVNGNEWRPQWTGDKSAAFPIRPFPHSLAGLGCKVAKVKGRGGVRVREITALRFVIRFSDHSPGAADYEVRITIAPERWLRRR